LVVGHEWRLIPPLRAAAAGANPLATLTSAVAAQVLQNLSPSAANLGAAFADLAFTGRNAYSAFVRSRPREGVSGIEPAATAMLVALGAPGLTPAMVSKATTEVLDRAYQVAWFLRGETDRGGLGWIAVSGEDDLPHRPVNVPRTPFPQHDQYFSSPAIWVRSVQTGSPSPQQRTRRLRQLFVKDLPGLAEALAVHGVSLRAALMKGLANYVCLRRLGEARASAERGLDGAIERIADWAARSESGDRAELADLPEDSEVWRAVASSTDTRIGAAFGVPLPAVPVSVGAGVEVGVPLASISLLPFMEKFIIRFVAALSSRLGGGSRVVESDSRRSWAEASAGTWHCGWHDEDGSNVVAGRRIGLALVASARKPLNKLLWKTGHEVDLGRSRSLFPRPTRSRLPGAATASSRECSIGIPPSGQTQPDSGTAMISGRSRSSSQASRSARDLHVPVSPMALASLLEELMWSWRDRSSRRVPSRVLLGAGADDDIDPAHIFTNRRNWRPNWRRQTLTATRSFSTTRDTPSTQNTHKRWPTRLWGSSRIRICGCLPKTPLLARSRSTSSARTQNTKPVWQGMWTTGWTNLEIFPMGGKNYLFGHQAGNAAAFDEIAATCCWCLEGDVDAQVDD
jgi:hypothetical protein